MAYLRRSFGAVTVASVATLALVGTRVALGDRVDEATYSLAYVLAVTFAAWYGGLAPGLLTTLASVALTALLFVPPALSLRVQSVREAVGLLFLLVGGVVISLLSESLHRTRRRLERERERLRESGEFHTAIGELGADLAFSARVEPDGRVVTERVMDGLARTLGYTLEDVVSRDWAGVVRPEDRARFDPAWRRLLAGEPCKAELRCIARDGRVVWLHFQARPVCDADGRVARVYGAFRDVSAAKQGEEALRHSEERFRSLAMAITSIVWTTDASGRFVTPQPSWERYTGHDFEEHRGDGWLKALHPDDREEVARLWKVACETRAPYQSAGRIWFASSGEYRHFEARAVPVLAPDGSVREWVGKCLDVEARWRAERSLQESEARLARALTAARMVAWQWEPISDRLATTGDVAEVFGLAPGVRVETGADVLALVHPEDRAARDTALREKLTADESSASLFRILRPVDGRLAWLEERAAVENDPLAGGERRVGVLMDVTPRVEAEAALRAADRSKNEFLATLSHELRNPLAPILNAVHLMRRQSAAAPLAEPRVLEMVERQLAQMVHLIDDLMDVSRITRGALALRREPTDLGSLLKGTLAAADPVLATRGHHVELKLPAEPLTLDGDPVRLGQIFSNLLLNAAKYTERGGRIELRAEQHGGEAVVIVADTGIGIPHDQLPRIFEMFAQVHTAPGSSRSGLGIGLSLVKHLCELHGGKVTAESEGLGRGSTFTVRLPLCAPASAAPVDRAPAAARLGAPLDCRVLIVDDNEDAADSLALLLGSRGARVRVARDGLEAVEQAAEIDADVVLLDIGLPTLDGYEACRRIRAASRGGERFLVAVTGWGQPEDRRRCVDAGFDRHLVKPVDPSAIEAVLREAIERRARL